VISNILFQKQNGQIGRPLKRKMGFIIIVQRVVKMDSKQINIVFSTAACESLEKHSNETTEERFTRDFGNRFGGCAMVNDDTTIPVSTYFNTCSKKQITEWIDQWISENSDLTNEFKLKCNVFLENQFKRAQS
jgi:hypothetical protein